MSAKAALYIAVGETGISKSELACRLGVDEKEIRNILGNTALDMFGFDRAQMEEAASRIGPELSDIKQAPRDAA